MISQSGNGGSVRHYLLGELSEQEREQVERRLMSDDDLYEQLLLAEDELIDDYISGALSDQDREKFGRRFLQVPALRQDVSSVMALREHALKTAPTAAARDSPHAPRVSLLDRFRSIFTQPAVGVSFAAGLLAAVALIAWFAAQNSQLKKQVEQLQARQTPLSTPQPDLQEQLAAEQLRNEQLSAELLRQRELLADETRKLQQAQAQQRPARTPGAESRPGTAAIIAFTLTSGAVRESGEWKKIPIPPGTREVRIRLDLPAAEYRRYRAVVQTVGGREVWSRPGLRAGGGGKFVQLNVRAKLLSPEDYQVRLFGLSPSGEYEETGSSYYFRVLK